MREECRRKKALEAQRLGSEFVEARGRYAGPFPSLARDPTLHYHTITHLWIYATDVYYS